MLNFKNGKKILTTPIASDDLQNIYIGDIVYLTGKIVTCRDVAHRRLVQYKKKLPVDIKNAAIFHAGPIVKNRKGKFEMISIGPTTSMRMEKFEKEFIEQTGIKLIVGKGGMGENTEDACKTFKAIHCVFPAGCAVVAAEQVKTIEDVQWLELGMPEALWQCYVVELGPLIVSIDSDGRNIFKNNKIFFNQRKDTICSEICQKVKYIK